MGANDNLSLASLLPAGLGGRPLALGADAGEEEVGWLVGRVLRDELAAAGALEHRAAERRGAALRPLDRGAERVDRRELLLDPRDDPALLVERATRTASSARPPSSGAGGT